MMRLARLVAVAVLACGLMACASADTEKVKVTAYINVTSGCQEPTVELLESLTDRYSDAVEYEVVDFGSQRGFRRWKHDGLTCMGIRFNGRSFVRFPDEHGKDRLAAFMMPAGFRWTHADLRAVFAAIHSGQAQFLTEEQFLRAHKQRSTQTQAPAKSRTSVSVYVDGKRFTFKPPAQLRGGTAYVPLRQGAEALGIGVEWVGKIQAARLRDEERTVLVHKDEGIIINGRLLLPLRKAAEAFGCKVRWDQDQKAVHISSGG